MTKDSYRLDRDVTLLKITTDRNLPYEAFRLFMQGIILRSLWNGYTCSEKGL